MGSLNKTDIAYARNISLIVTVQKFTLKFGLYRIITRERNKKTRSENSPLMLWYDTTAKTHNKIIFFSVVQILKIFRMDGCYV